MEKQEPSSTAGDHLENLPKCLRKWTMGLTRGPGDPILGTYPTEMLTWVYQETWSKMFPAKNIVAEH